MAGPSALSRGEFYALAEPFYMTLGCGELDDPADKERTVKRLASKGYLRLADQQVVVNLEPAYDELAETWDAELSEPHDPGACHSEYDLVEQPMGLEDVLAEGS